MLNLSRCPIGMLPGCSLAELSAARSPMGERNGTSHAAMHSRLIDSIFRARATQRLRAPVNTLPYHWHARPLCGASSPPVASRTLARLRDAIALQTAAAVAPTGRQSADALDSTHDSGHPAALHYGRHRARVRRSTFYRVQLARSRQTAGARCLHYGRASAVDRLAGS